MKAILFAAFCLALAAPAFGGPALSLEETFPTLDEAIVVTLAGIDDPTAVSLEATYRPNSATTKSVYVGTFNEQGGLSWKPEEPGITTLKAVNRDGKKIASKNVATSFPVAPVSGIAVMLIAGTLLFGGAAWSLNNALRREE